MGQIPRSIERISSF